MWKKWQLELLSNGVRMCRLSAWLLTFFVLFGLSSASAGNGYQEWLNVEKILLKQLESYVDKVQKQQKDMQRFLDQVDLMHKNMLDPVYYYGNPLNAFITIIRLVNNWQHQVIDVIVGNSTVQQHREETYKKLDAIEFDEPTEKDVLDAASFLVEAQDSNDLTAAELAKEVLYVDELRNQNYTVNAHDCFVIGTSLSQLKHYDFAVEWLLEAQSRLSHNTYSFLKVDKVSILKELVPALQKLGNLKLAQKLNYQLLRALPKNNASLAIKQDLEKKLVLARL